ncbi:ubiquitin-conjugating enzyme E2 U isoform X18 [Rhinolophus sinicus]|uniref:ubiquitin-conjugating enzyme E2 U isoform X18 n=1 Tax=Rhinolophus sinicus TaxID=89399 RepID=UPI003D795E58
MAGSKVAKDDSSKSPEDSHKFVRSIKISFDDYYKTWSEIATSKAAECYRTPLLEDPNFIEEYYKWKKRELQHPKEWNFKWKYRLRKNPVLHFEFVEKLRFLKYTFLPFTITIQIGLFNWIFFFQPTPATTFLQAKLGKSICNMLPSKLGMPEKITGLTKPVIKPEDFIPAQPQIHKLKRILSRR